MLVDLVQHNRVGKLDLIDEQIDQRALILVAKRFATITQEIMRRVIAKQVHGIDHRDHGIELCNISKAFAALVAEVEGCRDGQRFRNAGAL